MSDRAFIGAIPREGAKLFMLAIVLSMITSEVMERAMMGPAAPPVSRGFSRPWLIGILLGNVITSAMLVGALFIPALWINDWRLVDGPVSIVDALPALWQGGAWFMAIAVGAFLVAAPLAAQGLDLAGAASMALGLSWKGFPRWSGILRRWSMIDVFGLAFLLFLLEGNRMVRTDMGLGTAALAITLASYLPLVALVRWLLGKCAGRAA